MVDQMLPFRDLLKPSKKFHWDDNLQEAFEESKLTITKEIEKGVRIFDKSNPHALRQTGPNMELASGYFRSTAPVPPMTSSAANRDGRSPW